MTRLVLALLFLLPLPAFGQTVQHPFTFTHVPAGLPSFTNVSAAWADYDGDGDLDLFLTGYERLDDQGNYALRAHLYRNDGVVTDVQVPGQERPALIDQNSAVTPTAFGDAAWADYDRDGDLDLVVLGSTTPSPPYTPTTTLYRNDSGRLSPVDANLPSLHSGQVAWADYDGDGDLDLLLTGTAAATAPYEGEIHLMLNQNGTFAETTTALPGVVFGTIAWRDFAGDERPDVYLSGLTADGIVAQKWEHRGGAYTQVAQETGVLFGRSAVSPRDGEARFALTGATPSRFYLEGATSLSTSAPLANLYDGGIDWGDLDGDGDLDVSVTGSARQGRDGQHRVYQHVEGVLEERNLLLGTHGGPLLFVDYDGDGDLDLFGAGENTSLYRNDRPRPAEVPAAPDGLVALVDDGGVTLRWNADTGSATYDVWIGTMPDRANVVAPPVHLASGRRALAAPGTVGATGETTLRLPPGTYFWGVQRVSAERVGSPFTTGNAFTLVATHNEQVQAPASFALDAPAPSPFSAHALLRYHLPQVGQVTLAVYDLSGRRVRTLVSELRPVGTHEIAWDGRDDTGHPLPSGLYICRLEATDHHATRTLVLIR